MSNIALSERAKWIGASESAALLGVSPYKTRFQLWHEKAGNIPPANLEHNERVRAGKFLEPAIAAWAHDKWQWPILKVQEYRASPVVRGMGASLDFQTLDGAEPVEIKNVDVAVFKENYVVDSDTIIDAPAHHLIQVQHQLACPPKEAKPAERGWLVVCVGGNQLYRMPIPRHERIIAKIEAEVRLFWESIAKNDPPAPDYELDATAIAVLYHGAGKEVADLTGNERARWLAETYVEHRERESAAKKVKDQALAELKVLMQDARIALIDGGYKITTSFINEATIHREAYWRFNVSKPKARKEK